jgi:hypothetical protein
MSSKTVSAQWEERTSNLLQVSSSAPIMIPMMRITVAIAAKITMTSRGKMNRPGRDSLNGSHEVIDMKIGT